jgi:nitrite reductase/ring-hydroxylating ferredoxin subunit
MQIQEWRVAGLDDLPQEGAIEFSIGGGDWPFRGILVRWNNELHAYANSCAHLGHPLNLLPDRFFTPDGRYLICASHGALFEPSSGNCIGGPCVGGRLESLPCRVENGDILVTAPDSARRD